VTAWHVYHTCQAVSFVRASRSSGGGVTLVYPLG